MKRMLAIAGLGVILGVSTIGTVFANEEKTEVDIVKELTEEESQESANGATGEEFRGHDKCKQFSEEALADLAEEKGITVDELKQELQSEKLRGKRGNKGIGHMKFGMTIEEMAEEQGLSVEELKEQMQQQREGFHEAMLEKRAAQEGLTVEEVKSQFEEKRQQTQEIRDEKLAELAEKQGISVEELKQQISTERGCKSRSNGM